MYNTLVQYIKHILDVRVDAICKQEQEVSKAHIPPGVAIRGCNTFREKTKLSKIS